MSVLSVVLPPPESFEFFSAGAFGSTGDGQAWYHQCEPIRDCGVGRGVGARFDAFRRFRRRLSRYFDASFRMSLRSIVGIRIQKRTRHCRRGGGEPLISSQIPNRPRNDPRETK